jgi:prepilin-type N-terminal cleavage/methylation domain-containing protein
MSRSADARAGFTLLEVVLAMTALAMLTAICYAAFHLGMRALEKGEVAVVTAQRLRVASDVLIRQVKSTAPYCSRNEDEEVYPYFFGTPTSMQFVTAGGLQAGGGRTRVTYRLEEDPPQLILTESPHFSSDALGRDQLETAGERSAVLLDGFRTLRFEYLLSDGADVEWRPSWDAREEEILPAAVRITVEGMPGIELDIWGQEIPLMAAVYAEGGSECNDELAEDRGFGGGAEDEADEGVGAGGGAAGGQDAGASDPEAADPDPDADDEDEEEDE